MNKITHLVLSGGGMHGVMYIGAFRYLYLENLHQDITHISATSIGTFVGLMLAFKLTIEEMEKVMYNVFLNDKFKFISRKQYFKLFSEYGLTSTKIIMDILTSFLKEKYKDIEDIENFTFMNLAKIFGVNMYFSVTNMNQCINEIFSVENTPNLSVFKASEASMSIPLLYKPVIINGKYYYDGGFSNNFPIKVFENVPDVNILGIILDKNAKDNCNEEIEQNMSFIQLLKQILNMLNILRRKEVLYRQIQDDVSCNKKCLRIPHFIPDNIPPINFMKMNIRYDGIFMGLTIDEINQMIYAGFDAMYRYILERSKMISEDTKKRLENVDCSIF